MSLPTFVAAGSGSTTAPAWPVGYAVGDIGLLFVVNRDSTIATPTGFTHAFRQIGVGGALTPNVLIDVFYRIATSTSETAPTLSGATTMYGAIVVYTNVNKMNPIHVVSTLYMATNPVLPGCQTQIPDCLVLDVFGGTAANAGPFNTSFTNDGSTLASQTKRFDAGTVSGRGACLLVFDGQKATPGICGITRLTNSVNPGAGAMLKIALQSAQQSLGRKSRLINTRM